MGYGWRYCVCGKKFYQNTSSKFDCPDCQKKEPAKKDLEPRGIERELFCVSCNETRLHKLTRPYHGKRYWKCNECPSWKLADLETV